MGKRGFVFTFVGERQKKGKWKSKFTLEALLSSGNLFHNRSCSNRNMDNLGEALSDLH